MKQSFLKQLRKKLRPSDEEYSSIQELMKRFYPLLVQELTSLEAKAFVGGSYAKNTMLKRESYDVDIFVRFPKESTGISDLLEKAIKKTCKKSGYAYERLHGSRDYFTIKGPGALYFEIVPVRSISKPKDAENVTDLSYFHVAYVKKHLSNPDDVRLAKQFCLAQGVYGAESYIGGFSGYALECLIIAYKGFVPFIRAMSRATPPLILDPEKHYRNKSELYVTLSESKRMGPIILIDPTWKERNVVAALSKESFDRFQKACRAFLARPLERYFEVSTIDPAALQKKAERMKMEYTCIVMHTDKPSGDIAGTKLKRGSSFILTQLHEGMNVKESYFVYDNQQKAYVHLIGAPLKQIIRKGPPISMTDAAMRFRKNHSVTHITKNVLYATIPGKKSVAEVVRDTVHQYKKTLHQMDVSATL